MPKLFNSKQTGIIITILILIFLGASYFFIYVPENEKKVQERLFRSLQNIDSNILKKINEDTSLINNLLYLNGSKKPTNPVKKNDSPNERFKNRADYKLVFKNTTKESDKKANKKANKAPSPLADSEADNSIVIDAPDNTLTIYANFTTDTASKIGIRFGIDHFIKPLLPPDVFDNYIVFDDTSKKIHDTFKIYETFKSGLNAEARDSLLATNKGISTPGLHDIKIGGIDYKLFTQPVTVLDQTWIVAGLISSKNYQKEKNQLPLWIVLMLLTAAIGIVVCIPWVKLYHMGSKDKLTVMDGIATVLVSMILMSLLYFAFFKYSHVGTKNKSTPDPKEVLADKVSAAFENELETAYEILDSCDRSYAQKKSRYGGSSSGRDPAGDSLVKKLGKSRNINLHQVYWVDKNNGHEIFNWVADVDIPQGINLSARDYFINIKNGRPNRIHGRDTFYVTQNISKATGLFTTVIVKNSRATDAIAGLGLNMKSLDSVIMPDGYRFAIIDESGEVRYHSQSQFNLNQNLKAEFSDSSKLVSSLVAKANTVFKTEYFGNEYNVRIKPLPDLPYYIVILENQEYTDTRDVVAYAFTLSMLLCLLIFLVVEVGIIFLASSKQSFFKKQLFETSWISPKISSHGQYNLAILTNFFIIGMMCFYFGGAFTRNAFLIKCSFLEYIYIILYSIILTSFALNAIFYRRYKIEKCYKHKYKIRAVIIASALILLVDVAAAFTLDLTTGKIFESHFIHLLTFFTSHFAYLLYYEIITIGFCLAAVYYLPQLLPSLNNFNKIWKYKWGYTHSYSMMATTRLIITSGIPVAFFFVFSYDYEQSLDTRYRQFHFAKDIIKSRCVTGNTNKKDLGKSANDFKGYYTDGISVQDLDIQDTASSITNLRCQYRYRREDYTSAGILGFLRFPINAIEIKNNLMNSPAVDSDAFFNKLTTEKSNDDASTLTYYRLKSGKYLVIKSANSDYGLPAWPLLFPAILLFYFIMHNVIRKLFALNLPIEDGWGTINHALLTDNDLNKLLLIVGSPGSGKLTMIKNVLKTYPLKGNSGNPLFYDKDLSKSNVFIADMILIPAGSSDCGNDADDSQWNKCVEEALKDQYSLVIINHLEYNMKDGKTNNMKLDLLEKLMIKGKSKIMIISTVHPVSFLDSYNQQIKQANKKASAEDKSAEPKPENELERWMVLFGHFRIIIEPLEDIHVDSELPVPKEMQYSHFLNKMEKIIPNNIKNDPDKIGLASDSMIFKLQLTSQYFYTYIWQSLTMEEKFLLYDLAEDGLVNSYDAYNLSILISKKLIINSDGTLMLFNKGFRNFILTAIGETEAKRIKAHVKAGGNWDNLKTPLTLVMLAILVFLFASQQEAYSRLVTYITALGAGIPAILKVFSLFGNPSKKEA